MYRTDDVLVLSPTDLTGFLACGHLTTLDRRVADGAAGRPPRVDQPVAAKYGDRHETAYLATLEASGRSVRTIERPEPTLAGLRKAEQETVAAMREGVEVVYQATFFDGTWVGHADFLRRADTPSDLGPWSYDVLDTKLSRTAHVAAFVQMASYAEHVERVQCVPPQTLSAVLGDGTVASLPTAHVGPYFRAVRARFLAALEGDATYPLPVAHCALCRWNDQCSDRRRDDDHLSLVAGIRRSQSDRLTVASLGTVGLLADADDAALAGVRGDQSTVRRLATQARLQVRARTESPPPHELLPHRPGQGLDILPPTDPGDVFFDLEGDPFVPGGLEYLFGLVEHGPDGPEYREWWAHDHAKERQALADVAGYLTDRKARFPGMHVYHYAPYETTALLRLSDGARKHGMNDAADQIDALLRAETLVDLYAVVRHSVVTGTESYSIKKLEPLYGFDRSGEVTNAGDSIAQYEEWLDSADAPEDRDPVLLAQIADYNRADCESTLRLRDWLLTLGEPPQSTEADTTPSQTPNTPSDKLVAYLADVEAAQRALRIALPTDPTDRTEAEQALDLLAGVLLWHRSEDVVAWQDYFRRARTAVADLVDDSTCVGGLVGPTRQPDGTWPGPVVGRSRHHTYTFPPQDCALRIGDVVYDPVTDAAAGTLVSLDPAGTLVLSRATARDPHLCAALIPGGPPGSGGQRQALLELAAWVTASGVDSALPGWRAARQLLLGLPPALNPPGVPGAPLADEAEDTVLSTARLVAALDHATLPVQGPPGAGKTFTSARAIARLVGQGRKVGITGPSHKVVTNLVEELADHAAKTGQAVRIVQKGSADQVAARADVTRVAKNADVVARLDARTVDVVAGTLWLFADDTLRGRLDVLFVDEAGQVSLADTLAVTASTRDVVLVGDPRQLAQPGAARHPYGVDVSGLAHALGDHATVPADRGVFLPDTYRMHPDITAWVGATSYDGRLRSAPGLERQRVRTRPGAPEDLAALLDGSGIRYLPIEHSGRRNASPEEAEAVARVVDALVGGTWTDRHGHTRLLTENDVLVVAPFNAHVAALRSVLPAGVRAGTVDKFQGQEAPVTVYSMATSTAEDSPRGIDFLYSLNRLNVAVSRARGLSVVVLSPELLAPRLAHARQIPLVSAVCDLTDHGPRPGQGS